MDPISASLAFLWDTFSPSFGDVASVVSAGNSGSIGDTLSAIGSGVADGVSNGVSGAAGAVTSIIPSSGGWTEIAIALIVVLLLVAYIAHEVS